MPVMMMLMAFCCRFSARKNFIVDSTITRLRWGGGCDRHICFFSWRRAPAKLRAARLAQDSAVCPERALKLQKTQKTQKGTAAGRLKTAAGGFGQEDPRIIRAGVVVAPSCLG